MYYKSNPGNYTRCEKCKYIDRDKEECKITNDKWLVSDDAGTCHQYEGVNMKVRCITDSFLNLTLNNEYEVIQVDCDFFYVKNDLNKVDAYSTDGFEIITANEKLDVDLSSKYYAKSDFLIDSEKAHDDVLDSLRYVIYNEKFDESMEKVGKLASKCGVSSDEYWDISTREVKADIKAIRPSHYKAGSFDVIAFCFEHDLDFATGNIIKYVTRAGKKDKDKTLEDLYKGMEYLKRRIEFIESKKQG